MEIESVQTSLRLALETMALACVVQGVWAVELRFPELFHGLSFDLTSPHIPWGKPIHGKRLRLLIIGPRWGMREVVELKERFDAECRVVMLYCKGRHWAHERVPSIWKDAVLNELRRTLRTEYDVLVMGYVPASEFPKDVTELIKQRVRAGVGLVYLWPEHKRNDILLNALRERLPDQPPLEPGFEGEPTPEEESGDEAEDEAHKFLGTGIPFEALREFGIFKRKTDSPKVISIRDAGKGRAVFVNYGMGRYGVGGPGTQFLTPVDPIDLHYECCQSFLIKAILLAGRALPGVLFEDFPPNPLRHGVKVYPEEQRTDSEAHSHALRPFE